MCGVFGIYGHPEAANLAYLGIHALQHRGQESAGIVSSDGKQLFSHRGMGHVIDVFSGEQLVRLKGHAAIGHVRYSTAGGSFIKNAQPIAVNYAKGSLALGHNGNLTNADGLREKLEARGSIFQSDADSEVIVHLIAKSAQRDLEDRIADALGEVEGAYSLLCLDEREMIAVRDPVGVRPLALGELPDGTTVVASEPSSFDLLGARLLRELEPGEMLIVNEAGRRSVVPFAAKPRRLCIFEYVYFSRPDSTVDGIGVYEARKSLGRALAHAAPIEADIVVPVPDSGVPATIGYATEAGLPFEMALVRSHYVGRTFIEPEQSIRNFGVKLKLSPVSETLRGKRVIVVDDSIVRGTTSRKIVTMLRGAGAREVHLRISSPPTTWPCYYGIDTPTRAELIAATHTLEGIREYITADSLAYLPRDAMVEAVTSARRADSAFGRSLPVLGSTEDRSRFCDACWTGDYPISYTPHPRARQLRLLDA